MKVFYLLLFISFVFFNEALSQASNQGKFAKISQGPNVYALIVGVSDYQFPEMYKPLEYADDDGREFYHFLVKSKYGNVKAENIDTLFNERATSHAVMTKLIEYKEKLKQGDLFYFYFSGHGDAYDADLAFLLAYDAPPGRGGKEKNHYLIGSGVLEVKKIKDIFRRITVDDVKLVFISDACRTNEIAGGAEGKQFVFKKVMEDDAGEIRFTSCASNQKSFESASWGGGRGVFSYHLVNGLSGLADADAEGEEGYGEITVKELEEYVFKSVTKDTKAEGERVPKQTPQYACSMVSCDYEVLNRVSKAEKDKLILKLQTLEGGGGLLTTREKGVDLDNELAALGRITEYADFQQRIKENQLIGENSADEIYQKLINDPKLPEKIKKELKNVFCIHLNNSVNKTIYAYLDGSLKYREYSKEYFLKAYNELLRYKELTDLYEIDKDKIEANLLFLKGHSYYQSENTGVLKSALAMIDSAILINPNAAYIYNIKGNYHYSLHQYDQAIKSYHKGIKLAPHWVTPSTNLSSLYARLGLPDSARYYSQRSLQLDSNYVSTYQAIASQFRMLDQADSSLHYIEKGLLKDPLDVSLICMKGDLLMETQPKQASALYYQAIRLDSTDYTPYVGLLKVHLNTSLNQDSLTHYMTKILLSDVTKSSSYRIIAGLLYDYGVYDVAATYYDLAYTVDSLNTDTWLGAGDTYFARGSIDTALMIYNYALMLDSNFALIYNRIGNLYYQQGDVDAAIQNYLKAYQIDPWTAVYTKELGFFYKSKEDYSNAVTYYELHLKQYLSDPVVYLELIRCYALLNNQERALHFLREAKEKSNPYLKYNDLKEDESLQNLKKNKEFKSILKELKNAK